MQSDPGWSRFSALRCTVIINVIKNTKKKKVVLDLMPLFLETSFIESLYVADSIKNKMQKISI